MDNEKQECGCCDKIILKAEAAQCINCGFLVCEDCIDEEGFCRRCGPDNSEETANI